MNNLTNRTLLSFSLVICKLCGHKVKELNLPKILPKKIILRCSKCNSNKNIVGIWRGNKFKFTDKGISKEEIMIAIDDQRDLDEENDLLREKYEYHNDYDDYNDYHDLVDSMSPLEWDDEEEEWTGY